MIRLCAFWCAFMPTVVSLCPVTRIFTFWRVLMPSVTPLCVLTLLYAHWRVFVPSDTHFYLLTRLNAHGRVFVRADASLCPLACYCAQWHAFLLTDASSGQWQVFVPIFMPTLKARKFFACGAFMQRVLELTKHVCNACSETMQWKMLNNRR